MDVNVQITTKKAEAAMILYAADVDDAFLDTLENLAHDAEEALRESAPQGGTGNLKRAVQILGGGVQQGRQPAGAVDAAGNKIGGQFLGTGNITYHIGFKNLGIHNVGEKEPVDYVYAVNYGSSVKGLMFMDKTDPTGPTTRLHKSGEGIFTKKRTIKGKHFIEAAKQKTQAMIDVEVAKFLRRKSIS